MQLRAALAAVNTIDLRDSDDDVTSFQVHLKDSTGTGPFSDVIATLYGIERQPFITKVYATNAGASAGGGGSNPTAGYVAIELHNPDRNRQMVLRNFKLAKIARPGTPSTTPNLTLTEVGASDTRLWTGLTGSKTPIIPPSGYIVIASDNTPPKGVDLPPNVTVNQNLFVVHDLASALDNELLILRPRRGISDHLVANANDPQGMLTSGSGPLPYPIYNELQVGGTANLPDMVPVDSYDFTGLAATPPAKHMNGVEWYYVRPSDESKGKAWHFVYPGHYQFNGTPNAAIKVAPAPRLIDGTATDDFTMALGRLASQNGKGGGSTTVLPIGSPDSTVANPAYKDVPVQLNNMDFAGPNKVPQSNQTNFFPYGQFVRNGDILEVPYIGSYKLTIPRPGGTDQILELNPVTMDSVMALATVQQLAWGEQGQADNSNGDPIEKGTSIPVENIGRFCPIDGTNDMPTGASDDFSIDQTKWRYHWATRIFDYLTVQSPQDDYLPDVDPGFRDYINPQTGQPSTNPPPPDLRAHPYKYYPATFAGANLPWPVPNKSTSVINDQLNNPNGATEQSSSVDGLININTAPWRVLAAVPFLPLATTPRSWLQNNNAVAQSIVYYRDVNDGTTGHPHGRFNSLFELNDVPIYLPPNAIGTGRGVRFREVLASMRGQSTDNAQFLVADGDLTGITNTGATNTNKPLGDFEARFLMLNRVSNLLTTRSDSFTAYILVQGWRDAETSNPHLVVQRRTTLLIDRSPVTPVNKSADVTRVPSD